MEDFNFRPLTLADKSIVEHFTRRSECRNCDLNFMNLMSWRFLYDTEIAVVHGWLVFRFFADGHLAYQIPVGEGPWTDILPLMIDDARKMGHPFLLLGVCQRFVAELENAFPDYFQFVIKREYADYLYSRESLATLAGKKLQPKRNFVNRFMREHPDYQYRALEAADIPQCLALEKLWQESKTDEGQRTEAYENELRSMHYVFDHWEELGGQGGVLLDGGQVLAFTFGAPINYDTFDVCVEKADARVEGAYAMINREFVRHLPPEYLWINREEDLGIEGLRKAKLSYQPHVLLLKHAVMLKRPMEAERTV